jgi:hypothetical protein
MSRIQLFIDAVNERLLSSGKKEELMSIWKEITHYDVCTEPVRHGERVGKSCGKPCVKGKPNCVCHLPREKKQKEIDPRSKCSGFRANGDACPRFCVDETNVCAIHSPKPDSVECTFVLVNGVRRNEMCAKNSLPGKTLCRVHFKKTIKQENEQKQEEKQHDKAQEQEQEREQENEQERKQKEREQKEREQKEREQKEREQKEREQKEQEQKEREQKEREQKEREQEQQKQKEREQEQKQKEREQKEREQKEREQKEREQKEREQKEREQKEREQDELSSQKEESSTTCKFVLKSGVNKGKSCGKNNVEGKDGCVFHAKK